MRFQITNIVLYVSTSNGSKFACAVLYQPTGMGTSPQPVAFYSTAYSEVELGLLLCHRAMAGVYLMYEKASVVTMGYPVTILTHHSLSNILNHGKYSLTVSRLRDYHRLLEQEDVTLARNTTVDFVEHLPTPEDELPHHGVKKQMGKPMLQGERLREVKSKGAGFLAPYLLEKQWVLGEG